MQCPKCTNIMKEISNDNFSAMKCEGCSGLWFKDASHEIAKTIQGIPEIDKSDTNAAAVYNDVREIECPECDETMYKMIDKDQFHIEFEACGTCDGVYFDSGEFQDYADNSLLEKAKHTFETLMTNLKG